uniref:Uncharacterized protein n=1 Tax=Panagrolaimus sp. JU765 TaxID=591449 RepID=A0AC34QCB9_9BILA
MANSSNDKNGFDLENDIKKRLEILKNYALDEIRKCDELTRKKEKEISDLSKFSEKVEQFPKKLRHRNEWIPICDIAFIRGDFTDTNRFQVMLGEEYFVEKSAAETVQFIKRKIKRAKEDEDGFRKQKELAESRLEFAQNLFNQESELVEIQDEYSEEKMRKKPLETEVVESSDHENLMEMLDKLEEKETEDDELSNIAVQPRSEKYTQMAGAAATVFQRDGKPPGVSQEEYDKFQERLEELMISSDEDVEDYDEGVETEDVDELDSDDSIIETPSPKKSKKVRFHRELEAGPSNSKESKRADPKPILRNKDQKILIDEEAIKAMNDEEKPKQILPQTDAFKGTFVERNVSVLEPAAAVDSQAPVQKPMSRFKAQRIGLK